MLTSDLLNSRITSYNQFCQYSSLHSLYQQHFTNLRLCYNLLFRNEWKSKIHHYLVALCVQPECFREDFSLFYSKDLLQQNGNFYNIPYILQHHFQLQLHQQWMIMMTLRCQILRRMKEIKVQHIHRKNLQCVELLYSTWSWCMCIFFFEEEVLIDCFFVTLTFVLYRIFLWS